MANEKRLIDANALEKDIRKYADRKCTSSDIVFCNGILKAISRIKEAPTVDAVEVVHARWVKHKPKPEAMRAWHRQGIGKAMSENSIFWTCSCCEEWGTPRYSYCPNCGAKMDGGNEDG